MVRFVITLWMVLLFGVILVIATYFAYDLEIPSDIGDLLLWTVIIMVMISGLMILLGWVGDRRAEITKQMDRYS